jgi:hypothetical protein
MDGNAALALDADRPASSSGHDDAGRPMETAMTNVIEYPIRSGMQAI